MADLTINLAVAGEEIVTGALRRVGEVAINALGAALKVIGDFAVDSFKGAIEAQAGIDRLTGSITRLGDASPVSVAEAMALSQEFKNLVGGSDDMVLAMQDVILHFDKIGKDIFPRVIEQSADLAVALNTDPTSAARLLGKVLQDLGTDGVGSIGRLKAAGVALTEQQTDQIKALVDAGKVTEAQTVLLDALAATTGGSALTASQSFAGQMDIFKEMVADAGEGVAMKLLPPLTELASTILPVIVPLITGAADALGKFVETLVAGDISGALGQVGISFGTVKEQAQPLIDAALGLATAFQDSMPMIQQTVANMVAFVETQFAALSPTLIANVSTTLAALTTFWNEHGEHIMAEVQIAFEFITVTIGGALTLISGLIAAAMQLINGDWEGAWTTIKDTAETFINAALSIVGTNLDTFKATWQTDWDMFVTILKAAWDNIVLAVSTGILAAIAGAQAVIGGFTDLGTAIINGVIGGIQSAAAGLAQAAIDAVNGAMNAAKNALGIHSPSTVFAGIGQNMMAGMAQGILGGMNQPANAMQSVSSSIVNSGGNTNNYYGVQADMQAAYTRSLAGAF